MRHTMCPVEAELGHHEAQHHLEKHRPVIGPETSPLLSADHAGQSKPSHRDDEQLHERFRERRVCQIGNFLAIGVQPAFLMGINTLQDVQQRRKAKVGDIEGQRSVTVRDADSGGNQGGDENQGPEQVFEERAQHENRFQSKKRADFQCGCG